MAWQFYDAFPGGRDNYRNEVQGPMPRMRWVKSSTDKKHRMAYKSPKRIGKGKAPSNSEWDRKAIQYAVWLLQRDGLEYPAGSACAVWASVTNKQGKREDRIRAVRFGPVEIELPNWDWCPYPVMTETFDLAA